MRREGETARVLLPAFCRPDEHPDRPDWRRSADGGSIEGFNGEIPMTDSPASVANDIPAVSEALRLAALEVLADGIWISEPGGEVLYRNPAAVQMERMFWSRSGHVGTMEDVVFEPDLPQRMGESGQWSGEYHLTGEDSAGSVRSVVMEVQLLRDVAGTATGMSFHARDVSREWWREQSLQDRHIELEQAYTRLKETQTQLLQSEKMASIGQLAAGVAHEINNPIGYVHSNLGTLQVYMRGLLNLLNAYDRLGQAIPENLRPLLVPVEEIKVQVDYDFLQQDLPQLLVESREGIERVKKIVLDLRDFSHAGQLENDEWMVADVHRGLESTLNIVWNELKYKAEVRKDFGPIPPIECMPSQLNQVFLNLLVNAGQAIADQGVITVATSRGEDEICISISDDGHGIPPAQLARIFDPFFTTKPVGKGTGLGLALSYGIVQKHHGRFEVDSEVGKGTSFRIFLPLRRVAQGITHGP